MGIGEDATLSGSCRLQPLTSIAICVEGTRNAMSHVMGNIPGHPALACSLLHSPRGALGLMLGSHPNGNAFQQMRWSRGTAFPCFSIASTRRPQWLPYHLRTPPCLAPTSRRIKKPRPQDTSDSVRGKGEAHGQISGRSARTRVDLDGGRRGRRHKEQMLPLLPLISWLALGRCCPGFGRPLDRNLRRKRGK
jgi:hypothetical protein